MRKAVPEYESLEEPSRMGQVPLGWRGVRHRLRGCVCVQKIPCKGDAERADAVELRPQRADWRLSFRRNLSGSIHHAGSSVMVAESTKPAGPPKRAGRTPQPPICFPHRIRAPRFPPRPCLPAMRKIPARGFAQLARWGRDDRLRRRRPSDPPGQTRRTVAATRPTLRDRCDVRARAAEPARRDRPGDRTDPHHPSKSSG